MALPEGVKKVHFIGIGGYGMSALALILLQKGYSVSGSDIKSSPLTEYLAGRGALIATGHRSENLGHPQLVIYSTAIAAENPELLETKRRGLPLWHRSELLAALLNSAFGIAVAGAHGKTTTTAMVALLLEAGGLDPTAVIGGVLPAYGSNARLGKSPYLVAEADESDRSFTRYYPQIALVTGMEADHLEHYDYDYSRLKEAYKTFLSHLSKDGTAVLCRDDPGLRSLAPQLGCKVITYGLSGGPVGDLLTGEEKSPRTGTLREEGRGQPAPASGAGPGPDYHADKISLGAGRSRFDFCCRGEILLPGVALSIPGQHNILNAVGALALAHSLGLEPAACAPALAGFKGVGRRFEIIGRVNGVTVIDDYAHHPTEIRATLEAARYGAGRVICLFQPHRHSRTAAFFDQFAAAFEKADFILLHDIYAAGETALPGVTAAALAEKIRSASGNPVLYNGDISALEAKAAELCRAGDLIITMGAGDVTQSAPRITGLLQARFKA